MEAIRKSLEETSSCGQRPSVCPRRLEEEIQQVKKETELEV